MQSYGGLLKQKHKILNLDDAADGNLINTSDEDKTTDEEEKAHSITAIWNFEKQNYYLKDLKRQLKSQRFFMYFCPCGNYSVQPAWLPSFTMKILICMQMGSVLKNSTLVLLKFLFLEIAYIYLAHICVLRAYISFQA